MRKINPLPPQERLLELFDYSPSTGALVWRVKAARKYHPGMTAGTLHHSGYWQVTVDGVIYMAQRIIWKMRTGIDPVEVDHRNRVRSDNRWRNLRDASRSQNGTNKPTPGWHRGVHWLPKTKKFGAQIKGQGQHIWLGCFDTAEAACAAYRAKAAELHGEFAGPSNCSCR